MNKKALIYIALALLTLTFIFLIISLFAAALIMIILGMIFVVGSIVCLVIHATSTSRA